MRMLDKISEAARLLDSAAIELNLFTDEILKGPLDEGAIMFFRVKEAHSELDAARKTLNKHINFMNKSAIPEMLEKQGSDKISIPEIARSFYILPKYSASMVDKEKAFEWLRERGDGALITETVNAGTLALYMKDLIVNEGIDPPEDIFKFSSYNVTGISKYTPK